MIGNLGIIMENARVMAEYVEKRFGAKVSVEYEERDDPSEELVLIDGWIEIDPIEMVRKWIGGQMTVPGYLLGIEVVQHNYPHEPDDVDFKEIEEIQSPNLVVVEAFKLWFESHIQHVLEDYHMAKDYKREGDMEEDFS